MDPILTKDVMTNEVFAVTAEEPAFLVAGTLAKKGFSSVIVLDEKKPQGIITRRDLFEKVYAVREDIDNFCARDLMSFPLQTCKENDNLIMVASLMKTKHLKQIPVLNESGELAGIITQTDIIKNISSIVKHHPSHQ